MKSYQMEIGWQKSDEPSNLEHFLLNNYLKDHDELPPFNHAGSKRLKKVLTESISIDDKYGGKKK